MVKKIDEFDSHRNHRKHRNVLYGLVLILIVFQTVSFVVLSLQVTRLNAEFDTGISEVEKEFRDEIDSYNAIYQSEFEAITNALQEQESSFNKELKFLKSASEDFSGIINDAVKSVVSVASERSAGTGFIIDEKGFIVTNYHVIQGGSNIRVLTYEKKVLDAEVVGFDSFRDIALLKISGSGYEKLELADSDELRVGNKVIAIGNPLGLSFSVTEGIVSAVDREGPTGLEEYVQTDVSLNPGNSGGPLIDIRGRVVGINNFKIGGGAEGLGFALESDAIRAVVNELRAV